MSLAAQMPADQVGAIVTVNPIVKGRPLVARFELIGQDLGVRTGRFFRDGEGRFRSEIDADEIPGLGPLKAVSIMDPIARALYVFMEGIQKATKQTLPVTDFQLAVAGDWSLERTGGSKQVFGLLCERYAGTNPAGEQLEAWITLDYGLNLHEVVTNRDGTRKQEWRPIEIVQTEPDPAVFSVGQE